MKTFVFRESGSAPVPAQTVGEELERIRMASDGKLTPPAIVEASKPARAPLHPCFEWDNSKAGKEWRLHQARNLIRVVHAVDDETKESAPAFVHVRVEKEPYYQSTEVAVRNVDEWESAIAGLSTKLRGAKAALDDLLRVASRQDSPSHAVAVATIAKAFALIDETLEAIRH